MNRRVPAWAVLLAAFLAVPAYTWLTHTPPAHADTPPIVAKCIGDDVSVVANSDVFSSDVSLENSESWPGSAFRVWILIDEGASDSIVNRVYSDGSVGALNGGTALTAGCEHGFVVAAVSTATWNLQFETPTTVDHVVVAEVQEGQ